MTYYLSSGLRFNLEWLLFWGPWSPWKNSYSLKDEFKDKVNLESLGASCVLAGLFYFFTF